MKKLTILLLIAFGLIACNSGNPNDPKDPDDTTSKAAAVDTLSKKEAK